MQIEIKIVFKWIINEPNLQETHNGHDLERNDTYILIYFVTNIRDYIEVTKILEIHGGSTNFILFFAPNYESYNSISS
jgi:hypothetical protein